MPGSPQTSGDWPRRRIRWNPEHSSLHFKKLKGNEALWSIRVGRQYRALARRRDNLVVWVWIGHHSDYDRLVK